MSWIKAGLCEIAIAGGSDEINQVPSVVFVHSAFLATHFVPPLIATAMG